MPYGAVLDLLANLYLPHQTRGHKKEHLMREYTPPQLTIVGSVADLTQQNDVSTFPDGVLGTPILGEPPVS